METNHNRSDSRQNDYELEAAVDTDNYDYAFGRRAMPAMQMSSTFQQAGSY